MNSFGLWVCSLRGITRRKAGSLQITPEMHYDNNVSGSARATNGAFFSCQQLSAFSGERE